MRVDPTFLGKYFKRLFKFVLAYFLMGLFSSPAFSATYLCLYGNASDPSTYSILESSDSDPELNEKWRDYANKTTGDTGGYRGCSVMASTSDAENYVARNYLGPSVRISWSPNDKPMRSREANARKTAQSGASAASITVENISPAPVLAMKQRNEAEMKQRSVAEIARRRALTADLEKLAAAREDARRNRPRPAGYTGCKSEPGSKSQCVTPQ